jgi:hypothetical protein
MRKGIVEGDDFSVFPPMVVRLIRRIRDGFRPRPLADEPESFDEADSEE